MINKDSIFASAGTTSGSSAAGFTTGMIPGTVAKAEDVNMYMGISDEQLYSVCKEVANLLTDAGIALDPNSYTQLKTWAQTKINSAAFLTGIDANSYTSAPTQSGNAISFPTMKIVYNTGVYYGKTESTHQVTTLSAQTLSATAAGWADGVHFIYAYTSAGSSTSSLGHTQLISQIAASTGATKCFLGSVFVISGAFQANSWKFQPWLQITSAERRESPVAMTRGGFMAPRNATQYTMGDLEVLDEGINFDSDINEPSIKKFSAVSPYSYKFLYPGYNPSASAVNTLDTTHSYNPNTNTLDDISSYAGKYVVMVPCIAPTGQTLMIPPMKRDSQTLQIFDTMDAAVQAIYGLQYVLGHVADRVIYLGQSIVVRIGATDIRDPLQCITVGQVPAALVKGFTSAAGQSGGAVSEYRPMPKKVWPNNANFTAQNNAVNSFQITNSTNYTVTLPSVRSDTINELEIYFNHSGTGTINWGTSINWYTGSAPTFAQNKTYNIILEYILGAWYGGVLGVGV